MRSSFLTIRAAKSRAKAALIAVLLAPILLMTTISPAFAQSASAGGKDRIAILDFETIGAGGNELGAAVSERLRTRTAMGTRYDVVETRMIKQVMGQLGLQASGMFDENTISEVGRALAAKVLVVGSITKIGSTYSINARIIDSETLTTITSADVEGKSEDELNSMIKYLADIINGERPAPSRATATTYTPPGQPGTNPTTTMTTTTYSSNALSAVFFEAEAVRGDYRGDIDVYCQGISADGSRLWGNDGRPSGVSTTKSLERNPVAVPDGQGGTIVVFELEYAEGEHRGDIDIAAQRISPTGQLMWNNGDSPTLVASFTHLETKPVAIPDGSGGAIIAFQVEFTSGEYDGDIDVMAQHVDADGNLQWGGGERAIGVAASTSVLESNPVIISDNAGGAIVAYQGEYREGEYRGDIDIMAQRIDSGGNAVWNDGSSVSVASSTHEETNPILVSDGYGGAIAVFDVYFKSGDYRGDYDVMAQHVSANGDLLWGEGQHSVAVASSSTGLERKASAVADGSGGVIVAFEYEYDEGEHRGDIDIGMQRLDSYGNMSWQGGQRSVLVASSKGLETRPRVITDGNGGAVVVFSVEITEGEYRGDQDVMAQRVNGSGDLLWNDGERSAGVATAESLERNPWAVPDGSGGAVVFFEAEYTEGEYEGDIDIKAQRVDGAGEMVWNSGEFSTLVSALNEWQERHPVSD